MTWTVIFFMPTYWATPYSKRGPGLRLLGTLPLRRRLYSELPEEANWPLHYLNMLVRVVLLSSVMLLEHPQI